MDGASGSAVETNATITDSGALSVVDIDLSDTITLGVTESSANTYLTDSTYDLNANGSSPYVIDIDLGQNWTFEAEYRMDGNVGSSLNTVFSYGRYTDGILLRTLRSDGFYLKGQQSDPPNQSPNLFASHSSGGDGTNTNNTFVPVRITYAGDNSGGTLKVFVDDVPNVTHDSTDIGALDPITKQIWIGSAHHATNEGFDGAVRNITITSENITQQPIATSVEVTGGGGFDASQLPTELSDNNYAQLREMLTLSAAEP